MIDNITPSWLYIEAANRYVPPLTWGVVFATVGNSQNTKCTWQTPPGQIPASTLKLGTAQVIFTDQIIPPSSGVSLLTPSQPIHLLTAVGPFTVSKSVTVTPPPGANSLIVVTSNSVSFQVAGVTSNQFYLNDTAAGVIRANGVAFVPIDLATDTQYIVTVFSASIGNIYVDASFVVQSVAIENVPLPITINGITGGTLGPLGSLPVNEQGFNGVNVGALSVAQPYRPMVAGSQTQLLVFQRPTFHVVSTSNPYVYNAGIILIAAPGAGIGIVVRKIYASLFSNPVATAELLSGPQTLGLRSVDYTSRLVRQHFQPPKSLFRPFVLDDFLIGTNAPLYATATAALAGLDIIVTYSIVTVANWPQE